jgi:hypothetical protein
MSWGGRAAIAQAVGFFHRLSTSRAPGESLRISCNFRKFLEYPDEVVFNTKLPVGLPEFFLEQSTIYGRQTCAAPLSAPTYWFLKFAR